MIFSEKYHRGVTLHTRQDAGRGGGEGSSSSQEAKGLETLSMSVLMDQQE